jgi:hypothetical protein
LEKTKLKTKEILERLQQETVVNGLSKASKPELEEYSAALCHSQAFSVFGAHEFPQVCETVRTHLLRAHIENLQGHVTELHGHISTLNKSNAKIQWWVIALASASLIAVAVQTSVAIRGELREGANIQQVESQQLQSSRQVVYPIYSEHPVSDQAKQKND